MSVKGYICGTDIAEVHMGATDVIIYPSAAALKKKRKCWEECGIVEIEVNGKYIVDPMPIDEIVKRSKRSKRETGIL